MSNTYLEQVDCRGIRYAITAFCGIEQDTQLTVGNYPNISYIQLSRNERVELARQLLNRDVISATD